MYLGKEVSVTHQYAGVAALSFPLFWIAGAGSAVFWVIGKLFLFYFSFCMYSIKQFVLLVHKQGGGPNIHAFRHI